MRLKSKVYRRQNGIIVEQSYNNYGIPRPPKEHVFTHSDLQRIERELPDSKEFYAFRQARCPLCGGKLQKEGNTGKHTQPGLTVWNESMRCDQCKEIFLAELLLIVRRLSSGDCTPGEF